MNITKVRNSAAIVNYVKPGLEMVEIEMEGSLLLTASVEKKSDTFDLGTTAGSYSQQGSEVKKATRRSNP